MLLSSYRQPNKKVSDAALVSIAVLQKIHHQLYFSCWWRCVKLNFCAHLPSLMQASVRLNQLLPTIEAVWVEVEDLDSCLIDSLPLPICRSKRASRCKVREATMGFGMQGSVDGFKCHAWSTLNGTLAQYVIRPANQHDLSA
ncbi:hypothetical protein GCM10022631_24560 [Deinococcus rubellus]|uniref:hypothetical protein n=1 Tax=Deinococcus rubellus TaxID=1889240 RepID=UPI0031ED38D5